VCDWSAEEIDFIDWVFNSSAVLRERSNLTDQHEGLTYERDAMRREPFALRSSYFANEFRPHESLGDVAPMEFMPRKLVKEISSFKLST
jgi:hypothetical protein